MQQAELKAKHGICVNEICNKCHKPLDHIRFTRKDQTGEWCSRVCRDGVEAADRYAATRRMPRGKCCQYCGLALRDEALGKRSDARYCDATCKRNAARSHSGSPV